MSDRSSRIETRNPLLALPSYQRLLALPYEHQVVLRDILGELRADAAQRAEKSWQQNKGPIAAYWKAVSVYALHLRRDLARKCARVTNAPDADEPDFKLHAHDHL